MVEILYKCEEVFYNIFKRWLGSKSRLCYFLLLKTFRSIEDLPSVNLPFLCIFHVCKFLFFIEELFYSDCTLLERNSISQNSANSCIPILTFQLTFLWWHRQNFTKTKYHKLKLECQHFIHRHPQSLDGLVSKFFTWKHWDEMPVVRPVSSKMGIWLFTASDQ